MKECPRHSHGCGWDYIFYFCLLKGGCRDEYRELLPFNINWLPCKLKLYTINCDRRVHVWQITCHILCIVSLHHPSIHPKPSSPFGNQSCYESEWFRGEKVFKSFLAPLQLVHFCGLCDRGKKKDKTLGELNAIMRSLASLTTCVKGRHCLSKLNNSFSATQWSRYVNSAPLPACVSPSFFSPFRVKLNKYLLILAKTITPCPHKEKKVEALRLLLAPPVF